MQHIAEQHAEEGSNSNSSSFSAQHTQDALVAVEWAHTAEGGGGFSWRTHNIESATYSDVGGHTIEQ